MNERSEQIIELLKKHSKMSVAELSKRLYVCEMTVRRDLKALEADGYIKRYNGGAMLFTREVDLPFTERNLLHSKEKIALAKIAASYVEDGSSIFIDSSSTCSYIIPQLSEKSNIKIITNSVTSLILATQYHIPCVMIGGNCYDKDMCTVGSTAVETLRNINSDIAFFSSIAVSDDGIISDCDEDQTAVRKEAMKNAQKSVFIFIKSKQHKKSTYTLCSIDEAYKIIYE